MTAAGTVDEILAEIVERKRAYFHNAMNKGEMPEFIEKSMAKELAEARRGREMSTELERKYMDACARVTDMVAKWSQALRERDELAAKLRGMEAESEWGEKCYRAVHDSLDVATEKLLAMEKKLATTEALLREWVAWGKKVAYMSDDGYWPPMPKEKP